MYYQAMRNTTHMAELSFSHVFAVVRALNIVYPHMDEVFDSLIPADASADQKDKENEAITMVRKLKVIHKMVATLSDTDLKEPVSKLKHDLLVNFIHLEMCLFSANHRHVMKWFVRAMEEIEELPEDARRAGTGTKTKGGHDMLDVWFLLEKVHERLHELFQDSRMTISSITVRRTGDVAQEEESEREQWGVLDADDDGGKVRLQLGRSGNPLCNYKI